MVHIWIGGKQDNYPYAGQKCNLLVWRKRKALIEFEDGFRMVVTDCLRKI